MHNSMQEGLAFRIKQVRDQVGSTSKLKEITGISQSYLSRLMTGVIDNPGVQQLIKIAAAGNISVDYLVTGAGDNSDRVDLVRDIDGQNLFYFDRSVLDRLGVDVKVCRGFINQGDSIDAYQSGDLLLINSQMKNGDGIYLVDFGGGPAVRRLAWLPGGMVDVISDNYGSNKISVDDLNIIGRVVWAGIKQ
ncbi:XRE family transcriptional regulator [Endozoicomonas ascidiicola]|uniref:XRE family transcriptional regulator n=1 Tax=Endozoicomonas ascidiicola TaxID=1698521 RepID=UPI000BA38D1C|nr:helix-turn-helix domain-containing protein [Endozoicomonas ascidiicola]